MPVVVESDAKLSDWLNVCVFQLLFLDLAVMFLTRLDSSREEECILQWG